MNPNRALPGLPYVGDDLIAQAELDSFPHPWYRRGMAFLLAVWKRRRI